MRAYSLTNAMVAAHGGGPVVCLPAAAVGRSYALHDERQGAESVALIVSPTRAAIIGADGVAVDSPTLAVGPTLSRVDIRGPIEQRASYHECGGWSDGHDAIAERLCAALEIGDVLLVVDSPGGAHAGLVESVRRVAECKAAFGRTVTVYADEMIGSAAYWWAAVVGDEIYAPESGIVGSIGARSSHYSEAAHLASEGVAVTYFAWPDEGKVAFAPELPLSDLARERGERDVAIAGEAFAEAVASARGLTVQAIRDLRADALYGALATDAGIIDGVATYEETLAMALDQAGAQSLARCDDCDDDEPASGRIGARMMGDSMSTEIRSEAAPDKAAPGKPEGPETPAGTEPDSACGKCGSANEVNSKFCDQCGSSMAAPIAAEEPAEPDGDEPAEPDGDEPADPAAPAAKRAASPPPMAPKAAASLAGMLGLHTSASMPAIKSAILPLVALARHAQTLTGVRDAAEAVGALSALAADAAEVGKLRAEIAAERSRTNARERLDLLKQLAASGVHPRGELLVDSTDDAGAITVKPAALWGPGPEGRTLANLRGYVRAKLASAAPGVSAVAPGASAKPSPYQPDASKLDSVHVTDRDREIAASGNYDPQTVARARAALFSTNHSKGV